MFKLRSVDYRERAEEAERLAGAARDDLERAAYLRITHGWRDLAANALRYEARGF